MQEVNDRWKWVQQALSFCAIILAANAISSAASASLLLCLLFAAPTPAAVAPLAAQAAAVLPAPVPEFLHYPR